MSPGDAGFPPKANVFSDKGKGVERMLDKIGKTEGMGVITGRTGILPVQLRDARHHTPNGRDARSPMKLHKAEMRLYRAGLGHLVSVLRLIAKNGNNRKESIWELTRQ